MLPAEDEVALVDAQSHFMMGFRKTGEVVGREPMAGGRRPLATLGRKGITVVAGQVTAIDPAARTVEVDGRRLDADALVVALGARTVPGGRPRAGRARPERLRGGRRPPGGGGAARP